HRWPGTVPATDTEDEIAAGGGAHQLGGRESTLGDAEPLHMLDIEPDHQRGADDIEARDRVDIVEVGGEPVAGADHDLVLVVHRMPGPAVRDGPIEVEVGVEGGG